MTRASRIALYDAELSAAEAIVANRKSQIFAAELTDDQLAGFMLPTAHLLLQADFAAIIAAESALREEEGFGL